MKYIYSIEQGSKSGRIHFHVIMTGGLTINEIASIWGKGYVDKVLPLMFDQTGCAGIAKYFCKQKISDHNKGKHAKRYVASTNCIKPQPQNNDYRLTNVRCRAWHITVITRHCSRICIKIITMLIAVHSGTRITARSTYRCLCTGERRS